MFKSIFRSVVLVAVAATSVAAFADDIQILPPTYGGTGCPLGTASISLSPDQKAVSILFDQYVAQAGGSSGMTLDRKSCNLTIPVQVPQGYSISVFQVDYRGFNALPYGARSQFNVEYFFNYGGGYPQTRGLRQTKNFSGPQSSDYELTDRLGVEALIWTPCGAQANLRVNTSMMVTTNSRREQAMSTVDSADISAGLIYHIQWRRCP